MALTSSKFLSADCSNFLQPEGVCMVTWKACTRKADVLAAGPLRIAPRLKVFRLMLAAIVLNRREHNLGLGRQSSVR